MPRSVVAVPTSRRPVARVCEWNVPARYWGLVHGNKQLPSHAWNSPQPLAGAESLAGWVAVYAHGLKCSVGGLAATPQPGGLFGGWITPDLSGL